MSSPILLKNLWSRALIFLTVSSMIGLHAVAQQSEIESGYVRGTVYFNPFLGCKLEPPPSLHFQPDSKSKQSDNSSRVLITALGESSPGHVTPVMVFAADESPSYSDSQRSSNGYIEELVKEQKEVGYSIVHARYEVTFGGRIFSRVDLAKGMLSESVLVTMHKGFALVLIVIGGNEHEVTSIIKSTQLQFTIRKENQDNAGAG